MPRGSSMDLEVGPLAPPGPGACRRAIAGPPGGLSGLRRTGQPKPGKGEAFVGGNRGNRPNLAGQNRFEKRPGPTHLGMAARSGFARLEIFAEKVGDSGPQETPPGNIPKETPQERSKVLALVLGGGGYRFQDGVVFDRTPSNHQDPLVDHQTAQKEGRTRAVSLKADDRHG